MPETTRIQLSRNLNGYNCTVRQLTSALQFKSLKKGDDHAIREFDSRKCNVILDVDTLRQKTLKYIKELDNGSRQDIRDGNTIYHEGNLGTKANPGRFK